MRVYKIKFLLDGDIRRMLVRATDSLTALEIFEKKIPMARWTDIHLLETLPHEGVRVI
jgi:hypothetical protein